MGGPCDTGIDPSHLEAAVGHAAVGLSLASLDGRLVWANPALEALLGYDHAELDAVPFAEFSHPDDLSVDVDLRRELVAGRRDGYRLEKRFLRKDGQVIWARLSVSLVRDARGSPALTLATIEDITAWKQDQVRLQRQVEHLAALRTVEEAMAGSHSIQSVLQMLLEQLTHQLQVDAAAILLLDPRTQVLSYGAGLGFRTSALQYTRLRVGEGHAGRAAASRARIAIPDLSHTPGELSRSFHLPQERFVAYHAVPLVVKEQVKGVLEIFHRAALRPDSDWLHFLDALAGQAAIAIDNAALLGQLEQANAELTLAYDTTLEGWSRAVELRDSAIMGHTQRVTDLTLRLARTVGVPNADLVHIRRGALLHDVGKIAIPDRILYKPGPLTAEEWSVMRQHTTHAYQLLYPIPYLRPALDIPFCHHEKWDGSGYPQGLRGENIPLAARIFAVSDVWDALRSDRPYRPAWTEEQARAYISEQSARHFDPRIVETFLRLYGSGDLTS